jgi:hypothetical protein
VFQQAATPPQVRFWWAEHLWAEPFVVKSSERASGVTPNGMNRGKFNAGLPSLRFPARRFHFCVFLGQPTSQITDLLIPLRLRQHFANVLGIHNKGITVPHWPHVVDQAPSLIWAYAEQFSDLPPVDDLSCYVLQRGSYRRYLFRPIR